MSGFKLSPAQRFAVYTVHRGVCYLNGEPLYLNTMRIDHILPRSLKDDPERLTILLQEYGLPNDFDLESYDNWLPACDPCNSEKHKDPFRPTPIIQRYIDLARSKAAETKALAERVVSNQAISKALNMLAIAIDQGKLEEDGLRQLMDLHSHYQTRTDSRELRVTPQFTVLHERDGYRVVRTNYGVGYVPSQATVDHSCSNCGSLGPWSGARCLSCGHLIEDD